MVEENPPVPHLSAIEQTGNIVVVFSEDMYIVPDLQMIRNGTSIINGERKPVFDVEVIPGADSNPDELAFDWAVVSMTEREIEI